MSSYLRIRDWYLDWCMERVAKYRIPEYSELKEIGLWSLVWQIFFLVAIFQFNITANQGLAIFFGDKSMAMFDLWSINHFLSGVISIYILDKFKITKPQLSFKHLVLLLFLGSFCWEITEILIEYFSRGAGLFVWLNGNEHWSNRLIGDNLVFTLGGVVGAKIKSTWSYALIILALLFIIQVMLPSSMFLQNLIF